MSEVWIQKDPINWTVHTLRCKCGGEMEHKVNIKYAEKPFLHACNQCGVSEQMEHVYPRTVWEKI